MQVSYIKSTYYFTDYGRPEWWWDYPGYWGSNYWGNWGGWYYPYAVSYSFSTNSFISEIVDLTAAEGSGKKIPVLWTSYMSGIKYYFGKQSLGSKWRKSSLHAVALPYQQVKLKTEPI